MINSRKLSDLLPAVGQKCADFIAECLKADIRVIITSTYRDVQAQDAIYAQGRTVPGRIVTNCQGGDSIHQYRRAFDFVPLDIKGQPDWDDLALWRKCGQIGQGVGLEWGGSWHSFTDMPHMQDAGGCTLAQLKEQQSA